jgi:hypothetical protein
MVVHKHRFFVTFEETLARLVHALVTFLVIESHRTGVHPKARTAAVLRLALLPRSRTLRLSEVAELARFEPVQYQLEGARADTGAPRERMVQDADGE